MKTLIEKFPQQLDEAIKIGKSAKISFPNLNFNQVIVSGLGGSGIGASIVQEYVYDKLTIPFTVNKDYFVPKSVNNSTLFIACSYSGNTEETISALKLAQKAKANIVCITSGGELATMAKKQGFSCILIPEDMPPRACLGYSLVQILFILKAAKLLKSNFEAEIKIAIDRLMADGKKIKTIAKSKVKKLVGKQIAIYSIAGREALGVRFRQQLNENSKVLCWSNVIPEMTHNEIVGWRAKNENIAIMFAYHAADYAKNLKRLQILKKVVKTYNSNVQEIEVLGDNYWEKAFYFIHLTDWVSVFLADENNNNATEVKVIDHLKNEMSKN